jgi:hypothetical protein
MSALQSQHRLRLERCKRDLDDFEKGYAIESPVFYQRFEAGELGDAADFFEWAGLYELSQNLADKIQHAVIGVYVSRFTR